MHTHEGRLQLVGPQFEEPRLTLDEAVYVRVASLQLGFEGSACPDDNALLFHRGTQYLIVALHPRRYAVYEQDGQTTIGWPVRQIDLRTFQPSAHCRWLAGLSW